MQLVCFVKENSNPPRCIAHDVVIERRKIPIDQHAPSLGVVHCLVCPATGTVVPERWSRVQD